MWCKEIINHKFCTETREFFLFRGSKININDADCDDNKTLNDSCPLDLPFTEGVAKGDNSSAPLYKNNDEHEQSVGESQNQESLNVSIRRTRRQLFEYAQNNDFKYFITLTFDPSKTDSSKVDVVLKSVQKLTKQFRSLGIQYVMAPELHPLHGEALHIHGFITECSVYSSNHFDKYGAEIFKIAYWENAFGFSYCKRIDNTQYRYSVSNYLSKYMTKDFLVSLGKKRYWASKSLILAPQPLLSFSVERTNANWDFMNDHYSSKVDLIL